MQKIIFTLALFILAACGGVDESGVRGVSDKEIVIGTHTDLSGPLVAWGEGVRNGLLLAVEEINKKGGIHGRLLKLKVEDNGYDPKKAVLATRKLIDRDRIFAMVSPLGSPTTLASMPLVLRKGVLHVFPFTAARGAFEPLHKLKFSTFVPYYYTIGAGMKYVMKRHKVKKVGIIYQSDDFGSEVHKGAVDFLKKRGLKPVSVTSYKRGSTDFSTQVARMRADGADFLVMGTTIRETIGVAKAAQALGWKVKMVCTQACYTSETAALGGKAVWGIYGTSALDAPYADSPDSNIRQWYRKYKKRFDIEPNLQSLAGYISMRFFIDALQQTGRDLSQIKVAEVLEKMPSWQDPKIKNLPTDFTESDHLGTYDIFIGQITKKNRWQRIPRTVVDIRKN